MGLGDIQLDSEEDEEEDDEYENNSEDSLEPVEKSPSQKKAGKKIKIRDQSKTKGLS